MVARRKTKVQKRFRLKNQDYLQGSGLFSAIRDRFKQATGAVAATASSALERFLPLRKEGVLPPPVRKWLETYGDRKVDHMMVIRVPVEKYVTTMLNAITLGKFKQVTKNLGYDELFHLRLQFTLEAGTQWTIEKNEVIMLKPYTGEAKNQENFVIQNYPKNSLTMNEMLINTKNAVGDARFTNYSAYDFNCQRFISDILESNGLMTPEAKAFIMQDAQKIFEELPSYTKGVSKGLTDLAARFNRLFKGEKLPKNKITHNNKMRGTNAWLNHVAKVKSQNPDMPYKQVLVKAKASYNKSGAGISMAGRAMGNDEVKLAVVRDVVRGRKPIRSVVDQVAMGILMAGRNAPLRRMSTRPVKEAAPTAPLPLPVPEQKGNGRIVTKPPTLYPATTPPVVAPNQRSSKTQELGLNNYAREAVKFPISRVARPNLGVYATFVG